jgi:hypothetical protein
LVARSDEITWVFSEVSKKAVNGGLFAELKSSIDDEYSNAGIENPKILLTTSRDPSSRLTQFVKVRPNF